MQGESASPDQRLTERIQAGDVSAFDAFLKLHWAPLLRYIACFMGNLDDAKDIAQEAFIRFWEQRSRLRASGSPRSYLYRIAKNLAINERQQRELHRTLNATRLEERPALRTPVKELESKELRAVVEGAIAALPERRREAFVLAHLHKLPHSEIAELMGISPQTVANQISAALADLRQSLAPYLTESDGPTALRSR
jgi:RNA polymerase sigma-70 factor (ECF subfamily)